MLKQEELRAEIVRLERLERLRTKRGGVGQRIQDLYQESRPEPASLSIESRIRSDGWA